MESIAVSKQFRYETLIGKGTCKHLIFVLHGYGQLVHYFIRKFYSLDLTNAVLVAPEGMHRFYLNGTAGRVGASWMTKEWREQDIQENCNALHLLQQHFVSEYAPKKITVIGFSQGGATAARWISTGKMKCDHFISWASVFPPDVSSDLSLTAKKLTFVVGKNDPFFDEKTIESTVETYSKSGFQSIIFDGIHDIDSATLQQILQI